MQQIIALFGPPGSGKSTLIKLAQSKKLEAFDLELGGDSYEERLKSARQLFEKLKDSTHLVTIFGAADLQFKDFPKRTKFVLLLPPREEYERRVTERDNHDPDKSGQGGLEFKYDAFKKTASQFDLVVSEAVDPEDTLKAVFMVLKSKDPSAREQSTIDLLHTTLISVSPELSNTDEELNFNMMERYEYLIISGQVEKFSKAFKDKFHQLNKSYMDMATGPLGWGGMKTEDIAKKRVKETYEGLTGRTWNEQ